jgi:hypothetical protein
MLAGALARYLIGKKWRRWMPLAGWHKNDVRFVLDLDALAAAESEVFAG